MTTRTIETIPARSVLTSLGLWTGALMLAIGNASTGARCAREAERLFAKSDEELARLGLRRDQIIHHAFGPFLAS